MTTDSLATLADYADSLPLPHLRAAAAPSDIPALADPLALVSGTGQAAEALTRTALSAADVFGDASQLAVGAAPEPGVSGALLFLSGNLPFKLVVLACFIGLCLLVYYFRPYFYTLFHMFRSKLYVEKLLDEQSYMFDTFLRMTTAGGLLLCGIATVRFADLFAGREIAAILPPWAVGGLSTGLWGAAALVALFQYGLLKLTGSVTLSSDFTDRLIRLKRIVFSLAALLLAPTLLLFALTAGTAGTILGYVVAGEIVFMVFFLLYQTWTLFIGQNISILQWILYLCAVEIFPVSFLVVALTKNW